jgi:hypothetical protein
MTRIFLGVIFLDGGRRACSPCCRKKVSASARLDGRAAVASVDASAPRTPRTPPCTHMTPSKRRIHRSRKVRTSRVRESAVAAYPGRVSCAFGPHRPVRASSSRASGTSRRGCATATAPLRKGADCEDFYRAVSAAPSVNTCRVSRVRGCRTMLAAGGVRKGARSRRARSAEVGVMMRYPCVGGSHSQVHVWFHTPFAGTPASGYPARRPSSSSRGYVMVPLVIFELRARVVSLQCRSGDISNERVIADAKLARTFPYSLLAVEHPVIRGLTLPRCHFGQRSIPLFSR